MERHDDDLTTADLAEPNRAESGEQDGGEPQHDPGESVAADHERSPLLPHEEADDFQSRWADLQTSFVDEPRRSVKEGDTLVAELMQRLANSFAEERQALEAQWDRGDDVSTEDLRIALQRYRSFFDRLLSA
jgi:hypothetical protein